MSGKDPLCEEERTSSPPTQDIQQVDEQERLRRDMEESERLAWELMRQESMEAYEMQVRFMQENAESLSQEDLAALQLAINEMNPANNIRDEEEEGPDEESEQWDYDQLLELGQTIGDVKTERWRLRASSVISSLAVLSFQDIQEVRTQL